MTRHYFLSFVFLVFCGNNFFENNSYAQSECARFFSEELFREGSLTKNSDQNADVAFLNHKVNTESQSELALAFQKYNQYSSADAFLGSLLPREFILSILSTPETRFFSVSLLNIFANYESKISQHQNSASSSPSENTENTENVANPESSENSGNLVHLVAPLSEETKKEYFIESVRDFLSASMPDALVQERMERWSQIESISGEEVYRKRYILEKVLGSLSLSEVQYIVYGTDSLNPSPESLIGQYIAETGAQTVTRRFLKGPDPVQTPSSTGITTDVGEEKLVIAVSPSSFQAYLKYFKKTHFLIHHHTPGQGTLDIAFNGKRGSYGNASTTLTALSEGSLLPHILLSSTESQRMSDFVALASSTQSDIAKNPWNLPGVEGRNYCIKGGYGSCTHWFGNIPLGDKRVSEYVFPGVVDSHASNSIISDRYLNTLPRSQTLLPYVSTEPLIQRVWKVPGHQQLSHLLGLAEQNNRGEFANPGWVAVVLTGYASNDRVPFIFYVVSDHTAPIPQDFRTQINAY